MTKHCFLPCGGRPEGKSKRQEQRSRLLDLTFAFLFNDHSQQQAIKMETAFAGQSSAALHAAAALSILKASVLLNKLGAPRRILFYIF